MIAFGFMLVLHCFHCLQSLWWFWTLAWSVLPFYVCLLITVDSVAVCCSAIEISKIPLSLVLGSFKIKLDIMACNATSNITSSATSNALNSTIGFITLKGSHFTSPLLVFPIVVAGLCSIAFAVLIFISWRKKVASEWSRKKLAVLSSILIGMFM